MKYFKRRISSFITSPDHNAPPPPPLRTLPSALPTSFPRSTTFLRPPFSNSSISSRLIRHPTPGLIPPRFVAFNPPLNLPHKSYVGPDNGCSKTLKTCDWMAKIPDNTPLVRMNLPGTHDTSTCPSIPSLPSSYIPNIVYTLTRELLSHNTSLSHSVHGPVSLFPRSLFLLCNSPQGSLPPAYLFRCQERSLLQSLNDGIRVFDLRFAYNPGNDTIGFYHCKPFPSSPYLLWTYMCMKLQHCWHPPQP